MIDWTFRVGDLLVIASLAGASIMFSFKAGAFTKSIEVMKTQIETLQESAKIIAGAMTTMAVQKNQIERIEEDIKEIRHGRGFVQGERGVDREWP